MPMRPCLNCKRLTRNASRCDQCQAVYRRESEAARGSATARGYDSAYQRTAAAVLAEHRRAHGNWCPGWRREAHPADELTVDHVIPLSKGGTNHRSNLAILCRPCNSAKGDRVGL